MKIVCSRFITLSIGSYDTLFFIFMGVIQRQGLKNAFVTYLAVALGALNYLVVYPAVFSDDQTGILRFVTQAGQMLYPFAMLGVSALVVRFFPVFKDEKRGHRGFLITLLLWSGLGFLLLSLGVLFFKNTILEFYGAKSAYYQQFLPLVLPLAGLMGWAMLFSSYSSNFGRVVVPSMLTNLLPKIFNTALGVLFFTGFLTFSMTMQGVVWIYGVIIIALLIYLKSLNQLHLRPDFAFVKPVMRKEMMVFAAYGIMGSIGSALANQIDTIMVGTMINLTNVTIFTIAFFMADVLDVPRRAIEGISAPVISQAWSDNNMAEIKKIYQKSALYQFLAGVFFLTGIWSCIDDVFALIPNGERYVSGKYVVLVLGIGKLVDLVTGINQIVIGYSRYFRFNLYAMLALAVFNVLCNLIFIPIFHIVGAALATMSSLILFNVLKLGFIYKKIRIHPFSWPIAKVMLLGAIAYTIACFIPDFGIAFVNILVKAIIITSLFGGLTLYWQLAPELNTLFYQFTNRIFKK